MAVLATVSDYVTEARVLLQDTIAPYRYSDSELVLALSIAVQEARRIRPDLFLSYFGALPSFTANDSTAVPVDEQYRSAFVFYMVGRAQLRDDEGTQDSRAAAFIGTFRSQLLTVSP
ncbi:hypothetical protein [Pseudolabrys sp.]|uniref:hypothetical protein n=1 Tax=Pseudolabrys sp. TaxID=1960880 RepID=UPI003D0B9883